MAQSSFRWIRSIVLIVFACLATSGHDIPTDLTARLFVKPEGKRLRVLMRIPLSAVRDVAFPEQPGGYLDFDRTHPLLGELATLWMAQPLEIYEDGERLPAPRVAATNLTFSFDRSFASYDSALARVTGGKLDNEAKVVWGQMWFDALLEYPIRAEISRFSIRPGTEALAARVTTVVRYLPPNGAERAYQLHAEGLEGDTEILPLDPNWSQATLRFVDLGFRHILEGIDHLLFLFCLVIPLRRIRPLLIVITAFTLAHSITLIACAYGYAPDALWFPPLIETLIALSIVYMALENIVGATAGTALNPNGSPIGDAWQSRWMVTFAFGLVHGFGFSFLLRDSLQFAGGHLVASLLSFNVGIELGQVAVLLLAVPLLHVLFRYLVAERIGAILLSALIAHTGWHWMTERAETLAEYNLSVASIGVSNTVVAGAIVVLILAGLTVWRYRAVQRPA